jgi:hypothetical protein
VRSLGRLYQRAREWDRFLEADGIAGPHPELAFEIPEEAGIAADSVLHYLNLFIDDLARIVPFALAEDGLEPKEPDGFSALKQMLVNGQLPASRALSKLFTELNCETSWWSQGFKRGSGMRQRLTHYTDLVIFAGSTKLGDVKMSADVSLPQLEARSVWWTSRTHYRSYSQISVNGSTDSIRNFSPIFQQSWQEREYPGIPLVNLYLL